MCMTGCCCYFNMSALPHTRLFSSCHQLAIFLSLRSIHKYIDGHADINIEKLMCITHQEKSILNHQNNGALSIQSNQGNSR